METVRPGLAQRYTRARDRYHLLPALVLVLYLIIPLATIRYILMQYPGLDPSRFNTTTLYIVPASILLFFVALMQDSHPKGTRNRLWLDTAYVLLSLLWMFAILGGNVVVHSVYDGHPFSIDVTPLVLIGVFTAALNLGHDYFEYRHFGAILAAPPAPVGDLAPAETLAPVGTWEGTRPDFLPDGGAASAGLVSMDLAYIVQSCGTLCEPPPVRGAIAPEPVIRLFIGGTAAEVELPKWVEGETGAMDVVFSVVRGGGQILEGPIIGNGIGGIEPHK
jgi:hypothetical protein